MGAALLLTALLPVVCALQLPPAGRVLRRDAMFTGAAATLATVLPASADETLPSGLSYKVIKSGNGGNPAVGDLISIRFKGVVKATGAVFDDIMASVILDAARTPARAQFPSSLRKLPTRPCSHLFPLAFTLLDALGPGACLTCVC